MAQLKDTPLNATVPERVDGVAPTSDGNVALNAVRFSSQTLSPAQQTQALSNIGAVPLACASSQASPQNPLVDKAFVNSSIATNTATFRGTYNLVTDLGLLPSATEEQVALALDDHLAALGIVPENNDYCFVQVPYDDDSGDSGDEIDPEHIERIDRYKCTVTDADSGSEQVRVWEYEFSLNNSSFTAEQWAAINSGITAAAVQKLAGVESGAQVNAIEYVEVNGVRLTPDSSKAVNIPVASSDVTGVVRPDGTTITSSSGVISAKKAASGSPGIVQVGDNISLSSNNAVISVPNAGVWNGSGIPPAGVVAIGGNMSTFAYCGKVVVSVPDASTQAAGVVLLCGRPFSETQDYNSSNGVAITPCALTDAIRYMKIYTGGSTNGRDWSDRRVVCMMGESVWGSSGATTVPVSMPGAPALSPSDSRIQDFIVDVEFPADLTWYATRKLSISDIGHDFGVCVAEGEDFDEMITFSPGDRARLYFTETGFTQISSMGLNMPVFLVARQNIDMVEFTSNSNNRGVVPVESDSGDSGEAETPAETEEAQR